MYETAVQDNAVAKASLADHGGVDRPMMMALLIAFILTMIFGLVVLQRVFS